METKISALVIKWEVKERYEEMLTLEALSFVEKLERKFGSRRKEFL